MLRIREAIVVEGRYDKNTLSQMVDTVIVETSGFGIFKDKERLALLRRLAEKRGLIVLTDPDGAGFVIRSHLRGSIPPEQVKHAYVPDVYGKERRKRRGGKEGKLGVEGMRPEVLEAHRLAGDIDSILKVRVSNARAYDRFYQALISEVKIHNVTALLSMEELKATTMLPLG